MEQERRHLLDIYMAAIEAVAGDLVVRKSLQASAYNDECHVIAIGKVADSMMQGALGVLQDKLLSGLLISKEEGFSAAMLDDSRMQCVAGDHPIPTKKSLQAGRQLLAYIKKLPSDAHCLVLVSGGASSLVEVQAEGVTLDDLQIINEYLLAHGYDIYEINAVRKSLSAIKGGGLWRYLGDRNVHCLMVSDVREDDPAVIGSGLLFSNKNQTLAATLPSFILSKISNKKWHAPNKNFTWEIVASIGDAKRAAKHKAESLNYSVTIVDDYMCNDAVEMGKLSAARLNESETNIIIWGGETTVNLPENAGSGGRNQHLALAASIALEGKDNMWLLSISTDGVDGNTREAGALVDSRSMRRGELFGVSAEYCLQRANANLFLEESGDLIYTGETGTNVSDLLIGLTLLR